MRLVTVKVPDVYLEGIDELVKLGRYSSRSEAIRAAIRDLLRKELWIPKLSSEGSTHSAHLHYPQIIRVKLE